MHEIIFERLVIFNCIRFLPSPPFFVSIINFNYLLLVSPDRGLLCVIFTVKPLDKSEAPKLKLHYFTVFLEMLKNLIAKLSHCCPSFCLKTT